MRIALYVPSWPPGVVANGIVTYASKLVPALRQMGHEVYVLSLNSTDEPHPYTIDLKRFLQRPTLNDRLKYRLAPARASYGRVSAAIVSAVRTLVAQNKIDVVEIEESFGWSFEISRLKLVPVVVRLHGPWFLTGRYNDPNDASSTNRHREKWEKRGIEHAHFVTAPSAAVIQAVRNRYGLELARSKVIANPMEAVPEAMAWNLAHAFRDRLLYVGRFDKLKGGDLVLYVFNELSKSNPTLRLTFVGPEVGIKGVDGRISSFADFVSNYLSDRGRSRIDFQGLLNPSDVARLRMMSFAVLVASQYEIAPYAVLEAMALGCPVVATAVGGIPELIKNERNGLLVPSQDVKAMAVACKRLLDDPLFAARLGRQAWQDCREFCNPEIIAKETFEMYEQVIKNFKQESAKLLRHRWLDS